MGSRTQERFSRIDRDLGGVLTDNQPSPPRPTTHRSVLIRRMAITGSTDEDIRFILGLTPKQLAVFQPSLKKARSMQRVVLRKQLWRKVLEGHPSTLIFMAKNFLGMSDDPHPPDEAKGQLNELVKAIMSGPYAPSDQFVKAVPGTSRRHLLTVERTPRNTAGVE